MPRGTHRETTVFSPRKQGGGDGENHHRPPPCRRTFLAPRIHMITCMEFLERWVADDGDTGSQKDEYIVVARDSKNQGHALPDEVDEEDRRFEGEPVNKETWEYEHGEHLEPGVTYYCLQIQENGYDFEDPEWVLEIEGETDTAEEVDRTVRRQISKLEEKLDEQKMQQHPLLDVQDTEQLQAKAAGMGMAKAMEEGSMEDFKQMFAMVSQQNQTDKDNPLSSILSNVDSDFTISSPTDMAMMIALPELQDTISEGKQLMSNVNGLVGGGGGGGMGGGQSDTVEVDRSQLQQLQQQAQAGGGQPEQTQAPQEPQETQSAETEDDSGSFSMDDVVGDEGDADADSEADDGKWAADTEEPEPEPAEEQQEPVEVVSEEAEAEDEPDAQTADENHEEQARTSGMTAQPEQT